MFSELFDNLRINGKRGKYAKLMGEFFDFREYIF